PEKGQAARDLLRDAQAMLDRIIREKWLAARAVIGLFPANRVGHEDIEVYATSRANRLSSASITCASSTKNRTGDSTTAWPTTLPPLAQATILAALPSPPA